MEHLNRYKVVFEISVAEVEALRAELQPLLDLIEDHDRNGLPIPCHVGETGCISASLLHEDGATIIKNSGYARSDRYQPPDLVEYDRYWFFTLWNKDIPVNGIAPKEDFGPYPTVASIQQKLCDTLGVNVGGKKGAFVTWNKPGFSWRIHKDATPLRVHVPVWSYDTNTFCFYEDRETNPHEPVDSVVLSTGYAYLLDVHQYHTVFNQSNKNRLNLVFDIRDDLDEIYR